MRRSCWRPAAAAACVVLAVVVQVLADEEKVPLDQLPKAVVATLKARFKGAEMIAASKEKEKDQLRYEVAIKQKGQKIDVTLTPQGSLVEIEKQITAKDLPNAVTRVLEEKYPAAKYQIIEEIFKVEKKVESLAYYEVLLATAGKQTFEVQVAADGRILNEEKKDPSKKDE